MANSNIPKLENLPGIYVSKNDGGLAPESTTAAPRVLVIGTAGKGMSTGPFLVRSTALARAEFGIEGTLTRGMYEAKRGGAEEIALYRIGCTAAILEGVGGDSTSGTGYTITTVLKDDSAGADYSIWYDAATDRLVITNVDTGLVVFDNSPTAPIDEGEVIVSGYPDPAGGAPDIGTASSPVVMEDVSVAGTAFTAGTDGTGMSRMELYEALYKAYKLLIDYDFDVLVPMDVHLDDFNLVNQGQGVKIPVSDNGTNSYPDEGDNKPGTSMDSLGYAYVEEYEGEYFFSWRFSAPTAGDAVASIWPNGVGSCSSNNTKVNDGTAYEVSDWHEVNFAYQMARFLFEYNTNTGSATGVIGVRPFESYALADLANWIGKAPSLTLNSSTGTYYIASAADNGTGLLGNKFMVGRNTWRSGAYGGGFIAHGTEWLDSGAELTDDNDQPIDIGKYISVCIDYPMHLNNGYLTGGAFYSANLAAYYGGFYSVLPGNSAPTNKVVQALRMPYKIGINKLDLLSKYGFVALRGRPKGLTIADAATGALPGSDYRRLSTMRICKSLEDAVREVADPFIGEAMSPPARVALHGAIDGVLLQSKKANYITAYREFEIYQTPDMRVQGTAEVTLTIVPAFELREIVLTINLAKE